MKQNEMKWNKKRNKTTTAIGIVLVKQFGLYSFSRRVQIGVRGLSGKLCQFEGGWAFLSFPGVLTFWPYLFDHLRVKPPNPCLDHTVVKTKLEGWKLLPQQKALRNLVQTLRKRWKYYFCGLWAYSSKCHLTFIWNFGFHLLTEDEHYVMHLKSCW